MLARDLHNRVYQKQIPRLIWQESCASPGVSSTVDAEWEIPDMAVEQRKANSYPKSRVDKIGGECGGWMKMFKRILGVPSCMTFTSRPFFMP